MGRKVSFPTNYYSLFSPFHLFYQKALLIGPKGKGIIGGKVLKEGKTLI